ncbi:MAG: hypothetical protein NTY80_01110 [candidate division SR1 bacterium]|nr:hypothetical protein [candidate division SR1 bacterium]
MYSLLLFTISGITKMDIKKQVEYFKGLSYKTKRDKVLEMLSQLQGTHETFAMFYKTVNTMPDIGEAILVYIYQGILEIAEEIASGNKDDAQDKIKKMGQVLMMIRKKEEMEKEREGNPEELLKTI